MLGHMDAHTHTHTHTHLHAYTHIHTHTHTHSRTRTVFSSITIGSLLCISNTACTLSESLKVMNPNPLLREDKEVT